MWRYLWSKWHFTWKLPIIFIRKSYSHNLRCGPAMDKPLFIIGKLDGKRNSISWNTPIIANNGTSVRGSRLIVCGRLNWSTYFVMTALKCTLRLFKHRNHMSFSRVSRHFANHQYDRLLAIIGNLYFTFRYA